MLFLAQIERGFLATAPRKPVLWLRYIDDIFCIWSQGRREFNTFLAALDTLRPRLRFTAPASDTEVVFLNFLLYKGSDSDLSGRLQCHRHRKETMHMLHHLRGSGGGDPAYLVGLFGGTSFPSKTETTGDLFPPVGVFAAGVMGSSGHSV